MIALDTVCSIVEIPIITSLKNWDRWLFLKINNDWTNPFLDSIFPFWREPSTWIPLYIFLLVFVLVNFGWKVWPWVVFFLITVSLTDQISSHFLKWWVNRPRPCQDPALIPYVRELLGRCPGNPSFPSSHAVNHFGMAFFIYFSLKPCLKKWGYWFFFWAATISYGQVYVGVHYPIDIISGAILGSLLGYLTSFIFNKYIGLPKTTIDNG